MRIAALVLVTGCLVQPVPTRVPDQRIGPLALGHHETKAPNRKRVIIAYDVGGPGRGRPCVTASRVPIDAERAFTVVYFYDRKDRWRVDLEDVIGLGELADCDDLAPGATTKHRHTRKRKH